MSPDRKPKVVVADYDYGDVDIERSIVTESGFELVAAQSKTEDDVIRVASDADAVLTQYAEIGKRAIDSFRRCKIIARYGIGVDIVDVEEATRRNIVVTNVPNDWCMNEVADHAVALLMALVRKLPHYDHATRAGEWEWQTGKPIQRFQEGTVGLFSFGAIAKEVARRMKGFGVKSIIACDPYADAKDAMAEGVSLVSFEELLTKSDYLVIQAPLTEETRGRFGEAEFRRMKKGSILVNTARGPIVKDEDLYRVLSDGWLSGAGLDDIEEEPAKQANWKPTNPLFSLENVIITPHAAYYSEQSIQIVRRFASEEAVRVLKGKAPLSPVNKFDMPIGIAA
ncbi:MAG TPA: C-terminal binding protein [Terriglobales bacterium]|jgi:D-3-phosphoglycerate dehydrogenase|nr:C-terminal binding protein [Terriglobales bacterium]